MRKRWLVQFGQWGLLVATIVAGGTVSSAAATSVLSSPNYQVVESEFGGSSSLQSCSNGFCARASIGSMSGTEGSSGTTKAVFGDIAAGSEPLLEMTITSGASDLGVLSTEKTAYKTAEIDIRTYLSSGYTLQINGSAPKHDDYSFKTSPVPVAATPGTEFFGINLAQNTTPQVGRGPEQVPSVDTSFGYVLPGYATPNLFAFKSGDVVARSDTSSGRTNYTVSLVLNVSNSTPAGHFSTDFSAVVTPIY